MFDVWKNVLAEVEQAIPHEAYATWFKDVVLTGIDDDGVATIEVPNIFKVSQIKKKYDQVIREALAHNNVEFSNIKYVVPSDNKVRVRSREISLSDVVSKKARRLSNNSTTRIKGFSSGLNPNYTMDNFVVGSNNDLAASVAQIIIKEPGKRYNPFYLYGGPGLGKTHLIQAIGNALVQNHPELKVAYVPTNSFYIEFIEALQSKQGNTFTKKYQKVDVLIIDDIQMIVGKEATQQAFFDIFNELYQHGKQIIITSDRLPEQLKSLDERLSSRLACDGAYDIQLPKFEDKCAILRMKAEFDGVEIEDEAIEYIASNVKTNIRDLEREYKRVLTFAEFKGITPLEVINDGYSNTVNTSHANTVSPKKIVETVANYYDLTVKELQSRNRVSHIKTARQVAMYLLSEELSMSTTKIATEVGVKDHSTVMHGIRKIKDDLKLDFALREQIAAIREKLYA
ncbi:chromosomal replication initiator protein DnaA [Candidatus Saccharibacteria bacterium]|nr:chromosomal replication initiator protein DnaA [Candidatus Saccharibacteria bacterium]